MTNIFTAPPTTWTNDAPVPNANTFNLEIRDKFNNIITNVADKTTAQTLTNKTLTAPVINNGVFTGVSTGGVLLSKTGILSRAMTAASGNVPYTGVGFMPTSVTFHSFVDFYYSFSWSMVDSTTAAQGMFFYTGVNGNYLSAAGANACIHGASSAVDSQIASLLSYNADGFTLTWTKLNSPTGGLYVCYIAYR